MKLYVLFSIPVIQLIKHLRYQNNVNLISIRSAVQKSKLDLCELRPRRPPHIVRKKSFFTVVSRYFSHSSSQTSFYIFKTADHSHGFPVLLSLVCLVRPSSLFCLRAPVTLFVSLDNSG